MISDNSHQIYLDHNATSPLRPEARRTMERVFGLSHANPSSMHREGREARALLDQASSPRERKALLAAKAGLEERVKERTASVRLLLNIVIAANEAETLDEAMQTCLDEVCIFTGCRSGMSTS